MRFVTKVFLIVLIIVLIILVVLFGAQKTECYTVGKCDVFAPLPGSPPGGSDQNDYVDQAYANAWERFWCCVNNVEERPDDSKVRRDDSGREKMGCDPYGLVPCFDWRVLDPYLRDYADRVNSDKISFPNNQTAQQYWWNSWRWTTADEWIQAFKEIGVYGPKNKFGMDWTRSNECGPGVGACPGDECCSNDGQCGSGLDYCNSYFDMNDAKWVGQFRGEYDGWGDQAYYY